MVRRGDPGVKGEAKGNLLPPPATLSVMLPLRLIPPLLLLASCSSPSDFQTGELEPPDCDPGGSSQILLPQGFLENADRYRCDLPAGASFGPRFTTATGATSLVNGASTLLWLDWDGVDWPEGLLFPLALAEEPGYAVLPSPSLEDSAWPPLHLFLHPTAPAGEYTLRLALDDGSGSADALHLGPWLEVPLSLTAVPAGDVQVAITWPTLTDVDLSVVDPDGNKLDINNSTVLTGGTLDLTQGQECQTPDPAAESLHWPHRCSASADNYLI